jgi:plasmid maintenance system antidote protein VapI
MARKRRKEAGVAVKLREAIEASGRTLVDISQASGVHPAQLSRFVNRKRDLTFGAAARIIEALGLELTPAKKSRPRPRKEK